MATVEDVARWMVLELEVNDGQLFQEVVVHDIEARFGREFVYENTSGNPAIDRKVLAAFRKLTSETVVWERGDRVWRKRESHDEPGRQVD